MNPQGSARKKRYKEKRQYVLTFLASKGLTMDIEVVEALLEAAVFGLNAV